MSRAPASSTRTTRKCLRRPNRRQSFTNSRSERPVITIDNVTKLYGRTAALRHVTLDVARGEVLGLLGPNGSGKTTLLRLLTGYLAPTAGRLVIAGYDTVRQPMEARRQVGYVPETLPLYAHMRVGEFLTFMGRLRGLSPGATANAIAHVSER